MSESTVNWLVVSIVCFVLLSLLLTGTWLMLRSLLKQHSVLVTAALLSVDKAVALAAASDVVAYQGIRAMEAPSLYSEPAYDPSDAAEIARIREREQQERLSEIGAEDEEQLDDVSSAVLADFFG